MEEMEDTERPCAQEPHRALFRVLFTLISSPDMVESIQTEQMKESRNASWKIYPFKNLSISMITHQELFSSLSTIASQKYHIPPEISWKRKS